MTDNGSRALNLSWQPPASEGTNGIIQHYIINITEVDTGSHLQLETTNLSVVVDDLHPYYQYRCTVAAETVGLGPFSTPVIIQLPEDGKTTQNTTSYNIHSMYICITSDHTREYVLMSNGY